jgi:hypothetical protein
MVDFLIATTNTLSESAGYRFVIPDAERDQVVRYPSFGFEALPAVSGDKAVLMVFDSVFVTEYHQCPIETVKSFTSRLDLPPAAIHKRTRGFSSERGKV